jgi:hypothetical protein
LGAKSFDRARCVEPEDGRKILHRGRMSPVGDVQSVGHLDRRIQRRTRNIKKGNDLRSALNEQGRMKKTVKGTNEATCGNLDDHLHRTGRRLFRRAHLERRSGFDEDGDMACSCRRKSEKQGQPKVQHRRKQDTYSGRRRKDEKQTGKVEGGCARYRRELFDELLGTRSDWRSSEPTKAPMTE